MHKTVAIQGPQTEPVTVAEIQTHAIITGEDTYLGTLITTARRQVERYLKRALITQTWKVLYDCWRYELQIPFPPLVSVQSVKYYNTEGTLITPTFSTLFWTVTSEDPGRLIKKFDVTLPELQEGRPDAIEISFTAGYGAAADVPTEIKHAIKLWVTDLYEHRGTVAIGRGMVVGKIPSYVIDLIHDYRIYQF
jgi:uncharacterized phiE125 gp8 family phage protein